MRKVRMSKLLYLNFLRTLRLIDLTFNTTSTSDQNTKNATLFRIAFSISKYQLY